MLTMECNRDEAVRARDIAEKKYASQDFAGAKKFVLKAQQLFPSLEGLSQMLPVMEVHSVAQSKVGGGEMDWYGLLQVEPGADDGLIKKQYRKLALLLHPDKNKAVGAEAAFKLIGEAWGILSDKTKRQLHDMRRGVKMKVGAPRVVPSQQNAHFPTAYHGAAGPQPAPSSTFWTSCPRCKMQYQYLRTYENYQLQCHKCKEVFKAREINPGTPNGGYAWAPYAESHRQDFNFSKMAFNAPNGFMNGPFPSSFPTKQPPSSASAGVFSQAAAEAAAASKVAAAAAAASTAVPANNVAADVVQQTFQKVKRDRQEAEKETKRKEKELRRKESEDRRKEIRKQRDAARQQEAMDRLLLKRRENDLKVESKRKLETRATRRLKRKRRGSGQEDEEEVEEEDFKVQEQVPEDQQPAVGEIPRRRSARAKKNVSTYKVDNSDSDMEDFPAPKRSKSEDEAESEDSERVSPDERSGRNAGSQQAENGGRAEKGKSKAHDEKRSSGMNGGGELRSDAEEELRDGNKCGVEPKVSHKNGASVAPDRATCKQASAETLLKQEDTSVDFQGQDSSRVSQKLKTSQVISKTDPSSMTDERARCDVTAEQEDRKDRKLEEKREEKSPCVSPTRILRTRSKSSELNKKQSPRFPHEMVRREGEGKEVTCKAERKPLQTSSTGTSASSDEDEEEHIDVPDPDFHDFDSRRTETDILAGQIWAIYDDQDGMPRFYGRISRVCLAPFRVNLCWLEPTPATEQSNTWMEGSGLSITCGEFKIGKATISEQINIFSHMVLDKVGKGPVKIYPRKGEVWATYKDWDQDRTNGPKPVAKSKGDGHTYSYEMVEVLSDYTEEKGCKVGRLAKVKGFKTLFQKIDGYGAVKQFRSSDLPKFSHCVISERMYKDEALGVPIGALELDPAATPMDLILGSSTR
ncbi:hypothetical protein Mapa_013771 [Marchantia paleacea]|nr:hypothetical protein Mapa_013771 [Marchantia paleacea]